MVIDVHTHIFPPSMRNNRNRYFSGESTFKMVYRNSRAKLTGITDLIDAMDKGGVDKAVVFGFPWHTGDFFREGNDYILEAVTRFPKRLTGFCCLDPFHPAAMVETERCLGAGLSGVGELAFYDRGLDETCLNALTPIMALCLAKNLPVMIHANEPVGHSYPGKAPMTLAQIYRLIKRFPNNKLILAHWGGGIFFYGLLKKEVKDVLKNVYFDIAATPYLYDPAIFNVAVDIIGVKKILFGTDYPLLSAVRYYKEMAKAGLEKKQIRAITGENARALLYPSNRSPV